MPADNYRSSFECLCYSYDDDERDDEGIDVQADYIMYLIDTYGFNVFHPKYIETHWNGFSLDVFMELYVSETIWDEYNVDSDDDLMVEFGVRFVIKCLESTNKRDLRRFIESRNEHVVTFKRLLRRTVLHLYDQYAFHGMAYDSSSLLDVLLLELHRNDALNLLELVR
eukprot:756853_1